MLAALAYGQKRETSETWYSHLMFLKERYPIFVPGDVLTKNRLSLCLTFDNATFDFYHTVFPILKELKIKALVGVTSSYILNETKVEKVIRLKVPHSLMMQEGFYDQKAPFATWQEIKEMVASGCVEIASHSYSHCNLTFQFVNLEREVVLSKTTIEAKLGLPITSFMYPFGKMSPPLHSFVSQHYPYVFCNGSSLNFSWGRGKKSISRILIDKPSSKAPLPLFSLVKGYASALLC